MNIKKAAVFSAMLMHKFLVQQIETVVDEDKKISHERLAQDTEDALGDPAKIGVKARPRTRPQPRVKRSGCQEGGG